jgi:hypothetical protein
MKKHTQKQITIFSKINKSFKNMDESTLAITAMILSLLLVTTILIIGKAYNFIINFI